MKFVFCSYLVAVAIIYGFMYLIDFFFNEASLSDADKKRKQVIFESMKNIAFVMSLFITPIAIFFIFKDLISILI